jgi:hypothetical protein
MRTVTLTLADILSSIQVLSVIANTKMPVKTSYNINKMLKKVGKEADIFEEERQKIVEVYLEDGKKEVPKEKEQEVRESIQELMNQEVELALPRITIDMLEDLEISPIDLQRIEPLLQLEDDGPPV